MSGNGSRNKKRQRLDDDDGDEGEKTDGRSEVDVRLTEELRGLLGGRKYVKAKDLTREVLLEYAKSQGAVNAGGSNKSGQKEGNENVQLSGQLGGLFGGRKYVKAKDLTREILLKYAKRQGAVTEVGLLSVTVQTMGGTELEVNFDESQNTVKWLKLAIQDEQGISIFRNGRLR